jgi:manganese oxidase
MVVVPCMNRLFKLMAMGVLVGVGASTAHAQAISPPGCERLIRADVVALEQAIVVNRFGAFVPAGTLYALKGDIVRRDGRAIDWDRPADSAGQVKLRSDKRPRPMVLRANEGDCLDVRLTNLLAPVAPEERSGGPEQYRGRVPAHSQDPEDTQYTDANTGRALQRPSKISADWPRTRAVSFNVTGLEYVPVAESECPRSTDDHPWLCGAAGGNIGLNKSVMHPSTPSALRERLVQQGSLVTPGQSSLVRFKALREGGYFVFSGGAVAGGEGNGGATGYGLFGSVNVQPRGSVWYRSQVTHADLRAATRRGSGAHAYEVIDYDGARFTSGPKKGRPILKMLDGNQIVHSDINAIVALRRDNAPDHDDTTGPDRNCKGYTQGTRCGQSYREFTVILHDEVETVQAFPELENEDNPLSYLRDNMGINYGVGGMGAMVVARNRGLAPLKDCKECRAEEFFLSSWANGDPALVLKWSADGKRPTGAMYPDDPSNVHHSYLNDPVRFRNLHAGPKETHVFHLHAHQWVFDASDPGSSYLDSQTISPGASFSYEISFGGGNRNLSPGDSIFHCHLYPHFAQGMWELWRTHDAFEDGTPGMFDKTRNPRGRNLPDAEIDNGTENPALVPIPGTALPPMPTKDFKGYPFYIAGEKGQRPPQPPLDMDTVGGDSVDGGLPRHVLTKGNTTKRARVTTKLVNQDVVNEALAKGGIAAQLNARKVYAQNPDALLELAEVWDEIRNVKFLDPKGEPKEKTAMDFHAGKPLPGLNAVGVPNPHGEWNRANRAYKTAWANNSRGPQRRGDAHFFVNGREPQPGAPFADPCPDDKDSSGKPLWPQREYRSAILQTELTVNRHGWFDPQARILALEQDVKDIIDPDTRIKLPEPFFFRANSGDCVIFKSTNLVPNALALDDFQVYTPTDTIGQHIHLVKFDVTSSDGSGNGWNYEDGTFSPEEVRERVFAHNKAARAHNEAARAAGKPLKPLLKLKTHPLFEAACAAGDAQCTELKKKGTCPLDAHEMDHKKLAEEHPFCGAQRTVQRWWADPTLNVVTKKDHTLRTVFTHDHFGPSSHQQHGLYAGLVVEPTNSLWLKLDANLNNPERSTLLGGADLAGITPKQKDDTLRPEHLGKPLMLREDGGPTATRAHIVAPKCIGRTHTSPLNPAWNAATDDCAKEEDQTAQTTREMALAIADFAIVYNMALEPINPEFRDLSALRHGRRQVAINRPLPLAISSEDPGTQLINYRHEPIPLRIADEDSLDPRKHPAPEAALGGYHYQQKACKDGELLCTGDMANVFSTLAHEKRDAKLATIDYPIVLSQTTKELLAASPLAAKVEPTLVRIERWRKDFNCALYPPSQRAEHKLACDDRVRNEEPWRVMGDPATPVLPVYEGEPVQMRLIQGAQEAQHVFAMNGAKWLRQPGSPNSGYVAAQPLGISEHFEFDVKPSPLAMQRTDRLLFGSSVDQLWDGMWALMRAYGRDDKDKQIFAPQASGLSDDARYTSVVRLDGLRGQPIVAAPAPADPSPDTSLCADEWLQRLHFDVSAMRACQLTGSCADDPSRLAKAAFAYNQRLGKKPADTDDSQLDPNDGLSDPNAIVFVALRTPSGEIDDSQPLPTGGNKSFGNRATLKLLQAQYRGRPFEPLVLRAPAGACVQVTLRNHLPQRMPDGPQARTLGAGDGADGHNLMSMITDGFNSNQFRMSSSVSLSPPMMASVLQHGDGSNVGVNGLEAQRGLLEAEKRQYLQGSLVPPCDAADTVGRACRRSYVWWAGDYQLDKSGLRKGGQEIEFGALPLRSFGDVVKQPAHGAVGALVIGPKGSKVCPHKEDARNDPRGSDLQASICDADDKPLYRDAVLVLQDAVDARVNGDPLPNIAGAEEPDDYGAKAVNYRSEPIWARRGGDPSVPFEERAAEFDFAHVLSSKGFKEGSRMVQCQAGIAPLDNACEPETTIVRARAGEQLRLRIVHPGGHTRQQAIALYGHAFSPFAATHCPPPNDRNDPVQSARYDKCLAESPRPDAGSRHLIATAADAMRHSWTVQGNFQGVGPMMSANLLVQAGGQQCLPMDYLWASQASFLFDGGVWGLLRVEPSSPLPRHCPARSPR